jgi:Flp pilus assembly pilin Flp
MWLWMKRFWRAQQGAMAVETALIMPIVLVLLVLGTDTVNYFLTLQRLSTSAHAAGELIATLSESTDTQSLDVIFMATAPNGLADTGNPEMGFSARIFSTEGNVALLRWSHAMSLDCGAPIGIENTLSTEEERDVIITGSCMFWSPLIGGIFGMEETYMAQFAVTAPRRSLQLLCATCNN